MCAYYILHWIHKKSYFIDFCLFFNKIQHLFTICYITNVQALKLPFAKSMTSRSMSIFTAYSIDARTSWREGGISMNWKPVWFVWILNETCHGLVAFSMHNCTCKDTLAIEKYFSNITAENCNWKTQTLKVLLQRNKSQQNVSNIVITGHNIRANYAKTVTSIPFVMWVAIDFVSSVWYRGLILRMTVIFNPKLRVARSYNAHFYWMLS